MMRTDTSDPGRGGLFATNGKRLAILIIAWLCLFAGINTIPVETHEAYVLQTAREMHQSGEWVLPYFNREPRLKKPPLNYWLTLGIARLAGSDFEPWTGRACSMLAGLAVMSLTAFIGGKLHGDRAGFLAALLLLSTYGFCRYSHHARPDFLYATLCVMQLHAWTESWRARDGTSRQRFMAALGWALAGLATMSKGPQVPAVFLAGFLLFLLCGNERQRILKVLRPFSGLAIWCAITLPWWFLLQQRLEVAGIDIRQTQLSGSLLKEHSEWREILGFFYIIELLRLLLPSSLLIPLIVTGFRRRWTKPSPYSRLLIYQIIVMLAVFTLAGNHRSHYMLPLLPACALLLACWIAGFSAQPLDRRVWRGLMAAGTMALVACAALLAWQRQIAVLLWLLAAGAMLHRLLRMELRSPAWNGHPLASQLIRLSLLSILLFAGFNALPLRNKERERDREFARIVSRMTTARDSINSWKCFPDTLPYYVGGRVGLIDNLSDLKSCFEGPGVHGDVYLVAPRDQIPAVRGLFQTSTLATLENPRNPASSLVFMKIENPATDTGRDNPQSGG